MMEAPIAAFVLDGHPRPGTLWEWSWLPAALPFWRPGLRYNLRNTRRFASRAMAFSGIYAFFAMYFNTCMQYVAQARSEVFRELPVKYNMTAADADLLTTLPDLGFDVLPFVEPAWLADLFVLVLVAATHARFVPTPMGATIFRRWLLCLGTLFGLRGFAIVLTMLPNPLKGCKTEALNYNPFYAGLLILSGQIVTCADVLYRLVCRSGSGGAAPGFRKRR